jgi:hypothetical protein
MSLERAAGGAEANEIADRQKHGGFRRVVAAEMFAGKVKGLKLA